MTDLQERLKHLTPARHVYYEHPHYGAIAAIVAKVYTEVLPGPDLTPRKTGVVNLLTILPDGVPLPVTQVPFDAEATDGVPTRTGRWRWMFDAQEKTSTAGSVPTPLEPKAEVFTPPQVAREWLELAIFTMGQAAGSPDFETAKKVLSEFVAEMDKLDVKPTKYRLVVDTAAGSAAG